MPSNQPIVRRSGDQQATMSRRFVGVAPDAVYTAITNPRDLQEWLSAAGRSLTHCTIDLRVGGAFRFEFAAPGKSTLVMLGEFQQVVPGRRLVHTEAYEGYDWAPLQVTTELAAEGADTVLTLVIDYPTKAVCDADFPNLQHAMGTYDALATHLDRKVLR